MMIKQSVEHGLPEPDFEQRGGSFVTTVWRDWLSERVVAGMGLNERQQQGLAYLKVNHQVTNAEYQRVVGCPPRTAARDLGVLADKGIVELLGKGRGAVYRLRRERATTPPNTPGQPSEAG